MSAELGNGAGAAPAAVSGSAGAIDIPGLLIELGKAIDKAWEIYRDYLAAIEAARSKVADQAAGDLAAVDGKPPAS